MNLFNEWYKAEKQLKEIQAKCEHKNIKTTKNNGDYILRVSCKDCNKLLKAEFKKRPGKIIEFK